VGSIPIVSIFLLQPGCRSGGPRIERLRATVAPAETTFVSEFDHVTGLATRGDLQRTLERLLEPGRETVTLLICDLVGLKQTNERDGFTAGDALLRAAADRLRTAAEQPLLVARLGGDELVAVFAGPRAAARGAEAASRLREPLPPAVRAAAVASTGLDTPASLLDRLYATMRRS
jgi:diguanylate cyclase (GGDEF)-like protein